jgi:DNA-binding response OmpR family regulator
MSAPITILNVDDQEPQRYIKTRDLRQSGFDVVEATNGAQALQMVEKHSPAVVLLDVQLPDVSGFDVCRYVKAKWPSVMILMTSATFTTSADRTLGLDSGADSFLVQPAEPLELGAAINALLRIRRSEEELRRLNETLEQRVQDRVAELAAANVKLMEEIAQRQKAEAALVQAEKMQAVGQLTGGLAHDFNNLLTAVVGNVDLIRSRSADARVQRLAENALNAAQRGAKLTAQLLAFSRTQKLKSAPVDVNALILGMHNLLDQTLGASVAIKNELTAALPPAMADANQLELAILNLSINARDAMPGGGVLTIRTAINASDPSMVEIEVSDTGSGMPPSVIARAFDPFFTTKAPGKGTGLGLSQVYGIAKQCGGDVAIGSEIGKGTKVTIYLPRAVSSAAATADAETPIIRAARSEKLLVIDDDGDVRAFVTGLLSDLGYDVREASHGEEALQALCEFAPDLLILDFAMPGMNGAETALALRERCAGAPILFVSGFANSELLERAIGDAPLLRKPFRPAELAATVRSLLDERKR